MKPPSRWARIKRFCWVHFASDWQRAKHHLRETDRFYSRLMAEAEKSKDRKLSNEIWGEWQAVREPERDEYDRLVTIYWRGLAARHRVPEPEETDVYWTTKFTGVRHLNVAGIDYLDRAIYEKRKRRRDVWSTYLAGFTGLVGATAGLAAILMQCSK
jgi:hypothetical protein